MGFGSNPILIVTTALRCIPRPRQCDRAGRLVLRKRAAGGGVVLPKKRVTLYLDAAVVDKFKDMAGERGCQTLINETLKTSLHQADMETTIRRVIREELKSRKAA